MEDAESGVLEEQPFLKLIQCDDAGRGSNEFGCVEPGIRNSLSVDLDPDRDSGRFISIHGHESYKYAAAVFTELHSVVNQRSVCCPATRLLQRRSFKFDGFAFTLPEHNHPGLQLTEQWEQVYDCNSNLALCQPRSPRGAA